MSTIYLIPSIIAEGATNTIPLYILDAIKNCTVIFAENERTTRRFLKSLDKDFIIDNYEWFTIHNAEEAQIKELDKKIKENKNIAIISEAGCPGIADPGQKLINYAQKLNCIIKPMVGPSSILLALMASGMNGQHFEFLGYLPIEAFEREKKIRELEISSAKDNCTKICIETPYRNNQLLDSFLKVCKPETQLCIALDITGENEMIKTKAIKDWKNQKPELHKKTVVFLLFAANT